MISKYFPGASFLIVTVLLLTSCLGSGNVNTELSPDAQIHTISMSSSADSLNALSATRFTNDQLQKKIFNEPPLPYQFSVDSVKIAISSKDMYTPFSNVVINLKDPDTTFVWKANDSISFHRLKQITTTAPDQKTQRTYDFEINIHQQDPFILTWEPLGKNYLTPPVNAQKTVLHNNRFFTYYLSNGTVKAVSATNGKDWSAQNIIGLPPTIQFSGLIAANNAVYALDEANMLYKSADGVNWSGVETTYPVVAIYGELPSATAGPILVAVNDNGTIKFAETNDFSTITLMNAVPQGIPVKDFSATNVQNPDSHAVQHIVLSGGKTHDNQSNNAIWLLQEKDNIISHLAEPMPLSISLQGSSVFAYDRNKLYLLTVQEGKNVLMISENYGLIWKPAGENQVLPTDFPRRTAASVITDSENYIWIIGGISANSTQIVDAWRGRLNRLAQ